MTSLTQLSPLDGRYAPSTRALAEVFSEAGLIRARLQVEIEWLLAIARHRLLPDVATFTDQQLQTILAWEKNFSTADAQAVKAQEAITNHDVKALEYWMQDQCRASADPSLIRAIPAIHFALTSEDVNNLAINLQMQRALGEHLLPVINEVIEVLAQMAHAQAHLPMLARTHGQSATPVTLGKEIAVFVDRFRRQMQTIANIRLTGKLNGATGGMNAHFVALPNADWRAISDEVIHRLGLVANHYTTQIEPHDRLAEIFLQLSLLHTIALDLSRDLWQYIAMDYYKLKVIGKEVGSSTMPHKVNPIDFENAEGNFGLANALLSHLAQKLPISRLQRDLSDSTVQRNIGSAIGYSFIAWRSLLKGLSKLSPHPEKMLSDLNDNWEVLTEAVQTVLRAEGHDNAYDLLKNASRGIRLDRQGYQTLLESLPLSPSARTRLASLTPDRYLGINVQLAEQI